MEEYKVECRKKSEEKEGTKFLAENAGTKEMPLAGDGAEWRGNRFGNRRTEISVKY